MPIAWKYPALMARPKIIGVSSSLAGAGRPSITIEKLYPPPPNGTLDATALSWTPGTWRARAISD